MILEHGNDPVSARWNNTTNSWDVGERKKYRWCNPDNTPESEWFYTMPEVIEWIIDYDTKRLAI